MSANWRPVPGFEGRYEVSNEGQVASVPFRQRYVLRNGKEGFRTTKRRVLAQQLINSGYSIVHLHLNNQRTAATVHRIVAKVFVFGYFEGADVNHKDAVKTNNRAENLEWVTRTRNHIHAVYHGLNALAVQVADPETGEIYPSIREASRQLNLGEKMVRNHFIRL